MPTPTCAEASRTRTRIDRQAPEARPTRFEPLAVGSIPGRLKKEDGNARIHEQEEASDNRGV